MKKIVYYLIILVGLFSPVFVSAQEYNTMQLIPIDSTATVNTEKFKYQDFLYSSKLDDKGNSIITFNSIVNNTVSKTPVSINVLLFGEDQKNIGIVTYCTNKDYGNTYEGFKLNGNQAAPFSIKVTSKYFINDKGPKDVKYIAVQDDNKYCKIGGYSNYKGLTIDEIANGINNNSKSNISLNKYFEEFMESGLIGIILVVLSILAGFIIYGMILNALHKKMYAKATILAYIPIANVFITFKLAFGKLVALIGLVIYLIASVLTLVGVNFVSYIASILTGIAFIVVIIKLITKKYDMLSFDPTMKTPEVAKEVEEEPKDYSFIDDNQKALDLSYDDAEGFNVDNINDTNTFDVSSGEANNEEEKEDNNVIEENDNQNNDNDTEKKDESDLSKFFE